MSQKKHIIIINPIPMKEKLRSQSLHLPYGPLYLASSLIDAGYEVSVVCADNKNVLKQIDQLVSKNTLCFGISTMSGTQLANAILIAKTLKSKYPGIPRMWGGVHVTALAEQTLKSDLVDYIVWGEGENTIISLLEKIGNNDIDSLHGMPGIGFKKGDEFFIGENSGYTALDKTFHLPYHLLDMEQYVRKLAIGANREFPIWTSRGCPYRCRFCSNTSVIWPNTKIRYHTIDHVVSDVKTLVNKYGADLITLEDENFLMDEQRFIEMLKAIRNEGIFIKYRFAARVDVLLKLKEETWKSMKEYGVIAIGTAPESGSQKILDYMGKGIKVEQIYQVDSLLSQYGFYKTYNILICTPQENRDDLKLTLKLVSDLARTSMSSPYALGTLYKYIPLPGTELYEDAIRHGFNPPESLDDWSKFDIDDTGGTRSLVRPWISEENFDYIQQAICLVEKLNDQLRGSQTDPKSVREILSEIDRFMRYG